MSNCKAAPEAPVMVTPLVPANGAVICTVSPAVLTLISGAPDPPVLFKVRVPPVEPKIHPLLPLVSPNSKEPIVRLESRFTVVVAANI